MEGQLNKIKGFFKALTFNEDAHQYFVNGEKIRSSVSKVIKNFVVPFDSENVSYAIAKKRGVSKKEVLAEWKAISDEACERGTRVHLFGEEYPFNKNLKPSCKQEEAIVKFWEDVPDHIVPAVMELKMYHKKFLFAGTGDILLYNKKTGKYIIGDYKTNKDLFKNYKGKKLTGIFNFLLDMPLNKYQLQLSFYQILFEQVGFEVEGRKIIWLLKDGTYKMYDTVDYTKELSQYLKNNKV